MKYMCALTTVTSPFSEMSNLRCVTCCKLQLWQMKLGIISLVRTNSPTAPPPLQRLNTMHVTEKLYVHAKPGDFLRTALECECTLHNFVACCNGLFSFHMANCVVAHPHRIHGNKESGVILFVAVRFKPNFQELLVKYQRAR